MGNVESSNRSPRAVRSLKSIGKNKANDEAQVPTDNIPDTPRPSTSLSPTADAIPPITGTFSSNTGTVPLFTGSVAHNGLCNNHGCFNRVRIICGTCCTAPFQRLDPPVAQYCSEECLNQHRREHTPVCDKLQDRTALFRVVELAQRAFYVYREMNWHEMDVRAVEARDDMIVIKGKRTVEEDYFRFPQELCQDQNERDALLSFRAQDEANLFALEFVRGMLTPLFVCVEMVQHTIQNIPRKTVLDETVVFQWEIDSDESSDSSGGVTINQPAAPRLIWAEKNVRILKISMNSGEQYAILLSGAQYGYYQAVIHWDDYERNNITPQSPLFITPPSHLHLIQPLNFSLTRKLELYQAILFPIPGTPSIHKHLQNLNISLIEWQFEGWVSLEDLVLLPKEEYKWKLKNLLDFLEWKACMEVKPNMSERGRQMAREIRLRKVGKWDFKRNFPCEEFARDGLYI